MRPVDREERFARTTEQLFAEQLTCLPAAVRYMPINVVPKRRKKEGGGEEKGEEGGKEGEYWESCAEAARSLKTSLSRAKWLGRPSILPAGPDTSSVRHAV